MKSLFFQLIRCLIISYYLISPVAMMAADIDDSRVRLKVLGGMSYSTLTGETGVFGPTAGGRFDIRVSSRPVYVGAGIEYMNRGYLHNSNHSFVVPFLGSYHLLIGEKIALEPFAGTTISYGFDWKKWDSSLRLGCNLRANRWDFTLGYDFGFRHYDFNNADGRNQILFLGIGYNFSIDIH